MIVGANYIINQEETKSLNQGNDNRPNFILIYRKIVGISKNQWASSDIRSHHMLNKNILSEGIKMKSKWNESYRRKVSKYNQL